jgi:hypothetical protein
MINRFLTLRGPKNAGSNIFFFLPGFIADIEEAPPFRDGWVERMEKVENDLATEATESAEKKKKRNNGIVERWNNG